MVRVNKNIINFIKILCPFIIQPANTKFILSRSNDI